MFTILRKKTLNLIIAQITQEQIFPTLSNNIINQELKSTSIFLHQSQRFKSKQAKSKKESESESEKSDDIVDDIPDKNSKVLNVKANSMRIDALLKSGLGIARNKIDVMFYESKIRLNGEKILKKSEPAEIGDEIDIVRGVSPANPNFLIIARVEVLGAESDEDHIKVKIRRCKSLTVENYKDPWKSSGGSMN